MAIGHLNSVATKSLSFRSSDSISNDKLVNHEDSQWFSAQLQKTNKVTEPDNVAENIVEKLSSTNKNIKDLSDKANRALSKASRSGNPEDIMKANRSLSSFYLESLLTTKLISKGTQAIEKLTSLQ